MELGGVDGVEMGLGGGDGVEMGLGSVRGRTMGPWGGGVGERCAGSGARKNLREKSFLHFPIGASRPSYIS